MNRIIEIFRTLAFAIGSAAVITAAWYVWHVINKGLVAL